MSMFRAFLAPPVARRIDTVLQKWSRCTPRDVNSSKLNQYRLLLKSLLIPVVRHPRTQTLQVNFPPFFLLSQQILSCLVTSTVAERSSKELPPTDVQFAALLFVVCCLLSAVCCLLFAVCCLLFAVCRLCCCWRGQAISLSSSQFLHQPPSLLSPQQSLASAHQP